MLARFLSNDPAPSGYTWKTALNNTNEIIATVKDYAEVSVCPTEIKVFRTVCLSVCAYLFHVL